ncbi:MAG: LuxR C-terminal-related transcriptional regulator [Cytophagales bacterium]|nr:LuxR C-terminal-related transcriptional regulator [Cytophagales bacterium]
MKGTTKTGNEESLSSIELQILKLICQQRTTKQIGDEMCMSVKNVERYREHLLNKTNADNMAGLVMYAMKNKLFPDLE